MSSASSLLAAVILVSMCAATVIPTSTVISESRSALQDEIWTVMLYMAADATPELPWEDDINEMESVDRPWGLNVVALVDPYGVGDTMLLEVKEDPNWLDPTIVSEEISFVTEADMANPGMLEQFIETAANRYPADRYVLVLWGHGAGWRGVCPDGYDLLTLPELRLGLEGATSTLGRTLDMVIVDSCAEGTLECMYEIRDSVDYLVASEMNVQADGLPYEDVLAALAADLHQSPEDFGKAVVDAYMDWALYGSYYSATMALFDLSAVGGFIEDLGALSLQGYRYDRIFGDQLLDIATDAESYDDDWSFDAGDFLGGLRRGDLPLDVYELVFPTIMSYQQTIVYFRSYSNLNAADGLLADDASGATIYAPTVDISDFPYCDLQISLTPWFDFGGIVRSDDATYPNQAEFEVTYSDSPDDEDTLADAASVTWPAMEFEDVPFQAWVFGSYANGLLLLSVLTAPSPSITIEGVFGTLVLAVSADQAFFAVAYDELTIELHGTVELDVVVSRLWVPQDEGYTVSLIRPDAEAIELTRLEGRFLASLDVPADVDLGSMYEIQVTDEATGDIVGRTLVVFLDQSTNASVELFPPEPEEDNSAIIAIALEVLVSSAAIVGYAMHRRRSRSV